MPNDLKGDAMTDTPRHAIGALQSPPELLVQAWPIGLALAAAPIPAPLKFHSPMCQNVTLNQNPYGACVTFSGAYIQAGQELADEGRQLLPDVLDPLHTYADIKGLPYPFTPAQDTSPGLNPIQLWSFTKANGWLTKDGSPRRLDASYFMIGKPSNDATFLDAYQQTLLQLGPCQITTTWPNNWWLTDTKGYMASPIGNAGGHALEACGWLPCSDGGCLADYWLHQTWGLWGHDPELPNHLRVHGRYFDALGWEAWKVADLISYPEVEMYVARKRILDTRFGIGLAGAFTNGVTRKLQVWGVAGVPSGAKGVKGILTVTQGTADGYLNVGTIQDSNLNYPANDNRATFIDAPIDTDGTISITLVSAAPAHVIFSVTGYTA
jgi:hypothetical protein